MADAYFAIPLSLSEQCENHVSEDMVKMRIMCEKKCLHDFTLVYS